MQLPASVEVGNRITASEAVKRYELAHKLSTLCRAIDARIVRGDRVAVGKRHIYLVDPAELEEDLANLPPCGYPGCPRKALAPSGACTGPHARALETKGTKLSAETRARMSESQTKRHRRADEELERLNEAGFLNLRQVAAERRVAPNTVSRWVAESFLRAELHVVELEHLLIVSREELKRFNAEEWPRLMQHVGSRRLPHWSPLSCRRWGGRSGASKAPGPGAQPRGRPRGYQDEQEARALELLRVESERRLSDEAIGRVAGLSRRQVQYLRAEAAQKPS